MASASFSTKIIKWFQKNQRDLPWRKTNDPYAIWISEVMLQQTTIATVIPLYEKWLTRFPTIQDLAKASEESVLKQWQGLGYYSRARNLLKSAKIIVEEYDGNLPENRKLLAKLPGFGSYTTGAVLSFAFHQPHVIIDTNIRRVILRYLAKKNISKLTEIDQIIEPFLKEVLPKKYISDYNQGLMELGALICTPKEPKCLICPLNKDCQAYAFNCMDEIPPRKKKEVIDRSFIVPIYTHAQKIYLTKNDKQGKAFADFWDFPRIEIKTNEQQELTSFIEQQANNLFGETEIAFEKLKSTKQFFTKYRFNLQPYLIRLTKIKDKQAFKSISQANKLPMSTSTAKIIAKINLDK